MKIAFSITLALVLCAGLYGIGFWMGRASVTPKVVFNTKEIPGVIQVKPGETTDHTEVMFPIRKPPKPAEELSTVTPAQNGSYTVELPPEAEQITIKPTDSGKAEVVVSTAPKQYIAFVEVKLAKRVKANMTRAALYMAPAATEAGTDLKPEQELSNVTWRTAFVVSSTQTSEPLMQFKHSLGLGAEMASWTEFSPCVTYSPLRISRFRPAASISLAGRAGAGLQYHIWRPLHAGVFYTWHLPHFDEPEMRLTFTLNL